MASNIPDPKILLHADLLCDLSEIVYPGWEGYDRFLMKLRGRGISPKEKSESEKSVFKLFECLEARGLIDVGNYKLLLDVLEGQNEPARKLIQEYKAKMDAVVSEDEEGPCKKRRIEKNDPQPSCSYEQLNKATCTATLRVRSKPEERGLTRMDQQNNSNTFVQTQAVIKGKELLDKTGILIYTGLPGEGKTENALYIMNEWRREHPEAVYMMMDSVSEWDDVDPKVDSVIFLEDCLGKTNANTSVINDENKWKNIESCMDKGKVKLILTVRKHIYMRYSTKLENNKTKLFMKKNVIDLTSQEFFLTYENKKDILLKHCSNSNIEICVISQNENYKNAENIECKVQISYWTILKIIETNCVIGFPYTCYLFTCHPKYTKQGAKFFQKPLEVLKEIISELANTESKRLEKIQYGLMCYMMIKGGEIDLKSFDQKLWKKVFKSLAINSPSEREKLEAIDQLNHRYIIVENALLSFKHQTILECVALCFKDDNISMLLQFCSKDFITEYVRPADFEDIEGEVFIKLNHKDYGHVVQRFAQFLQNLQIWNEVLSDSQLRNAFSWVDNPLMDNKEFIALFVSIIKSESYKIFCNAACLYGKYNLLDSLYSEFKIHIDGIFANQCLRNASLSGNTDTVLWLLDHNIGLGGVVETMEYASTDTKTAMMNHHKITLKHVEKALMANYRFDCDDKTVKAMINRWPDIDLKYVVKLFDKCLGFDCDKALGEILTMKNFAIRQILCQSLRKACFEGSIKVLQLIVSRYSDLDMVMDNHGGTLAHYCVKYDEKHTIDLLSNRYVKSISSKTSEKLTCLHIAAFFGRFNIFEMLVNMVKAGLNITDRDIWDRSVLHYAMIGCKFASMNVCILNLDLSDIYDDEVWLDSDSVISELDNMSDVSDKFDDNSDNIINDNDNDKLGDTTDKSPFDFESDDIVSGQGNKSSNITKESDGLFTIKPPFDCGIVISEKGNNGDIPNESMNDNRGAVVMRQDCERSDIVIEQRNNNSDITNENDELGVIMPSYHCQRNDIVNDEKINNSEFTHRSDDRLGDLRDRSDHILGERLNTVIDNMWDIQTESSVFQNCKKFPGFGNILEYSRIVVYLLQNKFCPITDLDMVLDEYDCTLAHYCVVYNGISIIKTLCDVYPGLLSIQNRMKYKPIDLAVLLGRDKIFEMLYPISEQNHDELNRLLLQGREYTNLMIRNLGGFHPLEELICFLPIFQDKFCCGCSESYDVIHKIITEQRL